MIGSVSGASGAYGDTKGGEPTVAAYTGSTWISSRNGQKSQLASEFVSKAAPIEGSVRRVGDSVLVDIMTRNSGQEAVYWVADDGFGTTLVYVGIYDEGGIAAQVIGRDELQITAPHAQSVKIAGKDGTVYATI